jgi:hypothetical protein
MIFSLPIIIVSSIVTGLISGATGGYFFGNREREHRVMEENYDSLFTYILDNVEEDDAIY